MNYSTDDKPDTGYTAEDDQVDPFIRAKCGHLSTMEELDQEGFCVNCSNEHNTDREGAKTSSGQVNMNEKRARQILDCGDGEGVQPDNGLSCLGHYMAWKPGDETITLDSEFTLDEIEAIAWWIKNKNKPVPKAQQSPTDK